MSTKEATGDKCVQVDWVIIGSGNGLALFIAMPLYELVLIYFQSDDILMCIFPKENVY